MEGIKMISTIILIFGAVSAFISLISIIVPIKKLNIKTRKEAFKLFVGACIVIVIGMYMGGLDLQEEEDIQAAKVEGITLQEYLGAKEAKKKREYRENYKREEERKKSEEVEQKRIAAAKIIQVSMSDILSAYKNNEVRADNKYKGETIEVTGVVYKIGKGIWDIPYVLMGTGSEYEVPQLQAHFGGIGDDFMDSLLGQVNIGQRLRVVCKIEGGGSLVNAQDCTIK